MGSIRLYGATSGYLELQAPDVAPDATLTLPSDSVQPGLVHLHTETFSAVSSVSVNNVFNSTYENYLITWVGNDTNAANGSIRLRSSNVDDTASNYLTNRMNPYGNTFAGASATTSEWICFLGTTEVGTGQFNIYRPALTQKTGLNALAGNYGQTMVSSHHHSQAASYDGFTMKVSVGTFSGTIRVYGYRNS